MHASDSRFSLSLGFLHLSVDVGNDVRAVIAAHARDESRDDGLIVRASIPETHEVSDGDPDEEQQNLLHDRWRVDTRFEESTGSGERGERRFPP